MALEDATVAFQYGTPRPIRVVLRQPNAEETTRHGNIFITFCTATTARDPSSPAVRAAFEALAAGRDPEGTAPEEYVPHRTPPTRWMIPSLSRLPQPFRSFLDQVRDELHDAATRTVHVLRWRRNVWGEHSLDRGLMMLEGVHLGEVVVHDDPGETADQRGGVVPEVGILLGEIHGVLHLGDRGHQPEIGDLRPVGRRLRVDTLGERL